MWCALYTKLNPYQSLLTKAVGSFATAILVGELPPPMSGSGHFDGRCSDDDNTHAAVISPQQPCVIKDDNSMSAEESLSSQMAPANVTQSNANPVRIRAGILTVRKQ